MKLFSFDPYEGIMLAAGIALALGVWLPQMLVKRHVTVALLYIVIGFLSFWLLPVSLPNPYNNEGQRLWEKLAELAVIISLLGAGLRIDTPLKSKDWRITGRLLGIAMPLTIAAAAFLGYGLLGLTPAAALLLGAVLAPTDPVLAGEVQVGPPNERNDNVRFALTSEAGLNDGLAFPFTYLALRLAEAGSLSGGWLLSWFWQDVLYKIGLGVIVGFLLGRFLAHLIFNVPKARPVSAEGMGVVALCVLLLSYAGAELLGGYGFLAVFIASYTVRRSEHAHEFNDVLHEFCYNLENSIMALLLLGMGGLLALLLPTMNWTMLWYALLMLLLVRPLLGWLSLLGSGIGGFRRQIVAVFGIRGIGSIYYLAYALTYFEFAERETLWGTVLLLILMSATLHGLSAYPVMQRLDKQLEAGREEDD
jgi:NhaP-type Na+/H+ or K+/H+ antiporter